MIKVIRDTTSGLIIAPVGNQFVRSFRKKVTNQVCNLFHRNKQMLELVRDTGNQPIAASKGYPVDIISNTFIPPEWRDITVQIKAAYYQKAIAALGAKHTININLSADLIRRASTSGESDYIRRAIVRELKRKLKRDVDFWLVLETASRIGLDKMFYENCLKRKSVTQCKKEIGHTLNQGRPHLHGAIFIEAHEEELVKKAIRVVNGKESKYFMRDELIMRPITNVLGWATYATKNTGHTRRMMPGSRIITCTKNVSKLAKELYEIDRKAVRDVKKGLVHPSRTHP